MPSGRSSGARAASLPAGPRSSAAAPPPPRPPRPRGAPPLLESSAEASELGGCAWGMGRGTCWWEWDSAVGLEHVTSGNGAASAPTLFHRHPAAPAPARAAPHKNAPTGCCAHLPPGAPAPLPPLGPFSRSPLTAPATTARHAARRRWRTYKNASSAAPSSVTTLTARAVDGRRGDASQTNAFG